MTQLLAPAFTNLTVTGTATIGIAALTGVSTALTAAAGTNTTQLATTAFITTAIANAAYVLPTATAIILGGVKPDGTTLTNTAGAIAVTYGTTSNTAAQGNDSRIIGALAAATAATTYAPLASPIFTGTVTIPSGASISGFALLASPTFTGSPVVPGYLTTAIAASIYAPLISPTFTGTPVAPTAAGGTNTTQIATTAFVTSSISTATYVLPTATSTVLGGVKPDNVTIANASGILTVAYGIVANTAAQGNDSRIVGAEQTANKGAVSGYAPLDTSSRVPFANLPAALGEAMSFAGTWNASTNTPTLASGTGVNGAVYTVTVAGTTTLDTLSSWGVGDKAVFNGLTSTWQKIDGQAVEVISVAGRTGAVVVGIADVSGAAPLASPVFTGSVTIPQGVINNASIGATTPLTGAFTTLSATGTVSGAGFVSLLAPYALLASPTLSGIPLAPTATAGTNTTQIASTAFVTSAISTAAYVLPTATSTVLGGVKPDNVTITNAAGVLTVTYGIATNTAAQGNDSRIVGALAATTAASTYAPLAGATFTGGVTLTTLIITALPTTLPTITGTIWNNGGVLAIA